MAVKIFQLSADIDLYIFNFLDIDFHTKMCTFIFDNLNLLMMEIIQIDNSTSILIFFI